MRLSVMDCNDERLYLPIDRICGVGGVERDIFLRVSKDAWRRCLYCFSHINNSKFQTGGIQPYHTVQYGLWLYFLSNEIYQKCAVDENGDAAIDLCDKIFMVNMMITGMDIYYGHRMPDIFLPTHTQGAVFSPHAKIGNYFLFAHGANVGVNGGHAPEIGERVLMMEHSKILGNCHVGNDVIFGANSYIKDMDIPSNSLVFGQYPDVTIKPDRKNIVMGIIKERFC